MVEISYAQEEYIEEKEVDVYQSVPLQLDGDTEQRIKIAKYLKLNIGEAYTAKVLAVECGFSEKGTQEALRKAITILIESDLLPIVATVRGFMWVRHKNQLLNYINRLNLRMQGLQRRIDGVREVHRIMEEE